MQSALQAFNYRMYLQVILLLQYDQFSINHNSVYLWLKVFILISFQSALNEAVAFELGL